MKKKLIILQDGYKECGSAALLSIIRYYNGNLPISYLVDITKTDKLGTNFYHLKNAAWEVGLESKSYKITDISELSSFNCPFICQINNKNYHHFIVVYQIKKDNFIVMDPSSGKRIMTKDEFNSVFTGYIMIFKPIKKLLFFTPKNKLNNIIYEVIKDNKLFIIIIFILSLIFTVLTCIYGFYFKILIDNVLYSSFNYLLVITIVFSLIVFIKTIINYLRNKLIILLNQKIDFSIVSYTYKKILLLPYQYYKNKTTGEVISRINDLAYVKNMLSKIIVTVFLDLIISLVGGFILFSLNRVMFLFLILIVLIYLILLYVFRPLIKKMTKVNQENYAEFNSFLVESIGGFESLKGLNAEKIISEKLDKLYTKFLSDSLAYDKLQNWEYFLKELVNYGGTLIITFIGCYYVMKGYLTLGTLITFNSLLVYFLDPIQNIIDLNKDYYLAFNALKRANNLLEIENEKLDDVSNLKISKNVELKQLNFSFNGINNILSDINLKLNIPDKIMILGPSGSGKSTLLKLLYKYYDISDNQIFYDNLDIKQYPLNDIRQNICYISQNEILYTMTIKENIFLERNITYEDFIKVCKMTYVDEIASTSFLGYDSLLEENGNNLSGGQRQRIVLARSLLKNSKIILIDEGLNQVDVNLERKILKNIFSYYQDCLFIVVSHRLDNLDLFNQVIKINQGRIMEVVKKC